MSSLPPDPTPYDPGERADPAPATDEGPGGADVGTGVVPAVYLTDAPALGGRIKERPEDFIVEEIPLYEPSGEGEHVYLFVEKRGMSTLEMVRIIAEHFGVHRQAVGYAGLKDKAAVTRQVVSVHVPGRSPEDVPMLRHDRISILWADLHNNKLRQGHLRGNRFSIRIRGVPPTAVLTAKHMLESLSRTGIPNRIGEQRFGYLGNNHRIGRAMILCDDRTALDELLGPNADHPEAQAEARALYAKGEYANALAAFPRTLRSERDALRVLARGGKPARALRAIGRTAAEFHLTAFQSAVFNHVLDARMRAGTLGELREGDVAWKHDNRACFRVDRAALDDPSTNQRLGGFEISPSGPMWGAGMLRASGETERDEIEALESTGVTIEALQHYEQRTRLRMNGTRRPLRVPLTDPEVEGGVDEHGSYVRLAFDLPRGAFATVVLRELMKPELAETPGSKAAQAHAGIKTRTPGASQEAVPGPPAAGPEAHTPDPAIRPPTDPGDSF